METWTEIRALRANPPGLAAEDPARRRVFAAALEQSQQLHKAATTSGLASEPLPLFYSLSQAGRAFAAAFIDGDNWEYRSHGLSVESADVPLGATLVKATKYGAFPTACRAVGSGTLSRAVELGALWASLPELADQPQLGDNFLQAIRLEPDDGIFFGSPSVLSPQLVPAGTYFGPEAALPRDRQEAAMCEKLGQYPRATGWEIAPIVRTGSAGSPPGITLQWPVPYEDRVGYRALESIGLEFNGGFYLRPEIGDHEVSILMTWWALLYCISSVARYEPAKWAEARDVDASPVGVAVEAGLAMAEERIPILILEALMAPANLRSIGS